MKSRWVPTIVALQAVIAGLVVRADTGDPVGYTTIEMLPGEKGAVAISMVKDYKAGGVIAAVGSDFVEFPDLLPLDLKGGGNSAFLKVRTGRGAGMTFPVTGFSGNRVILGRSPEGAVSAGDQAGVRPDWTIGELLRDPVETGILTGHRHEDADTDAVARYLRRSGDPGVACRLEFRASLEGGPWVELTDGVEASAAFPFPAPSGCEWVDQPLPAGSRGFVRLKVEALPAPP